MSIEALAIALHHSKAKGTARLVLLGIANHDGDGGSWPSIETLCKYAGGVNARNAQRAVDVLEELGEVRRHFMQGGTHTTPPGRRPNRYEFLLRCPEWCDGSTNHRDSRKPLITFEEDLSEELSTGVADTPPGGAGATPPLAPAPPEPSLNHQIEKEIKKGHLLNRARGTSGHLDSDSLAAQRAEDARRLEENPVQLCDHGRVLQICPKGCWKGEA
jgi:hypothetical protein